MTSPAGVVDLSLPDYATLVARAGVHPDAEAARVGGASPAAVAQAGTTFGRAGGELDGAYARSTAAASTIGAAFVNDGAAVYDGGTHLGNLPAGFGEAGSRLAGTSSRLTAVADDLSTTMTATSSAVSGLHAELAQMRSQWAARVAAAATGPGGLIPEAAVPGLLAERDRVAAAMTGRVGQVGRSVTDRIRGYEVVVNDALRLLADQGFVPVADLDRPAPAVPRLEGGVDPTGLGTPLMAGYAADPVNTALGNFVEVEADLPFVGLLAGLTIARTYNSCSDGSCSDGGGPFGARWSCWATAHLTLGTWTAEYEGPDGQRVSVPRTGPDAFGRVPGLDASIEVTVGGAVLAWFDGRRWEFDGSGRIARTWAGPGTAVAFTHVDGRLVELIHERGRRVRLEWVGERIVAAHTDGRRVDYDYDAAGHLAVADRPDGKRRYDHTDGRVVSVTDADGVVELVNTYDSAGRVLTQRSPFGRVVTFTYDADGSTVVADDVAGPRNVYRHDHAGRLISVTDGHGHTQHRRFDRWGNPVEIVERGGAVTRQEFDQRSRPTRRTLPGGAVELFTWDSDDRVVEVSVSGPNLPVAITRLRYDGRERTPSEIVDAEGGVTRFAVDGGLVSAVTDADGVTVRYRHDADGHLVEAVDVRGGVTRIDRDPAGRPTASVTTPAGRRTELVHDTASRLIERRDPAGGVWRHAYTAAGRLCAVVDPDGARHEIRYGGHGEATELVDPLGAVTARRLDELGNLAAVVTAAGEKSAYRYDALCRLTAWSGPAGGTWVVEYDADGNPTATVDPTGVREDTTYDPAGRLLRTDDGLVVTDHRHDALGRPVAVIGADGTTREVGYDRCGRPVTLTGPDGGVTRLSYTPAGRLARVVAPSGRTERREYAEGRLATVVDGTGQAWRYRHDPDGPLVERISPAGLTESLTRDVAGRVARHHVPGHGSTAYAYDAAGRVVAVTDPHGRRQFGRDPAGRVVTATDALGHTTGYTNDADGRLIAVTDPLGQVTRYTWADGRVAAVTDPLGRVTRYRHDPAGRLREHHEPDGSRRTIDHDASGRPSRLTASRGPDQITVTADRDELARPVRVAETGAEPVELRWDRNGRPVERRRAGRVIGWSYDPDGLAAAVRNPDGTTTSYRRDEAGRVVGVEHPAVGLVELHRDPDGRLLGVRDSRVVARLGYTDGWLTTYDVTVDGCLRSTWLTRDVDGRVVAADVDGRPARYGYDAAGQLCSAVDATGDHWFGYDAAGRLVTENRAGGVRQYRHDAAGQLMAICTPDGEQRFGHDACGRRVTEDMTGLSRRYAWDPLGRLAAVTTGDGHARRLQVDALGELAGVDDVAVDRDVVDPLGPLLALGDTAPFGHGHPWAQAGGWGAAPFVPDWQHTPAGRRGDPWGCHQKTDTGPAIGYRGELTVDGLVWLRHRVYDPATRAFLTPDPLPPVPGTACPANPYHYAGNDPINAVDPLGLRPLTDADLAAQRAAGGTLGPVLAGGAGPLGTDPYRG